METDPQGPGAMALPWSSSECSSFPGKQLVQVESCPLKSWGDWGDSCLTDLKFLSLTSPSSGQAPASQGDWDHKSLVLWIPPSWGLISRSRLAVRPFVINLFAKLLC